MEQHKPPTTSQNAGFFHFKDAAIVATASAIAAIPFAAAGAAPFFSQHMLLEIVISATIGAAITGAALLTCIYLGMQAYEKYKQSTPAKKDLLDEYDEIPAKIVSALAMFLIIDLVGPAIGADVWGHAVSAHNAAAYTFVGIVFLAMFATIVGVIYECHSAKQEDALLTAPNRLES